METTTKAPTAAQLKLNHERTAKAVERLNDKAYNGLRYTAILNEGQPGVILYDDRPYGKTEFEETIRYETRIDQTIGQPVSYNNEFSESNRGTMCRGIYMAAKSRQNKLEGLRAMENRVRKAEEELEAAKAAVAARRAELGL